MAMQLDIEIQDLKFKVIDYIRQNFVIVQYFLRRLDDIQEFYRDNCLLNRDVIILEKSKYKIIVRNIHKQTKKLRNSFAISFNMSSFSKNIIFFTKIQNKQ